MPAIRRRRILPTGFVAGLLGCLFAGGAAQAGCLSQSFGSVTIHNCNGKLSTSQTVGTTTVHSYDGKLGTSQTVGDTTVHNFDGEVGFSQRIGNVIVHSGPLFTGR